MADIKFSGAAAVTTVDDAAEFPHALAGASKKITGANLKAAMAPVGGTYITQVAESGLSAEQALAALGTGILKNTTTTGVLSIAAGSDLPTAIPVAKLAAGLAGQVIGGTTPAYLYAPGYQFGIVTRASSNFTTTQTTQASGDTALTMGSITFDGATACNFQLSCLSANSVTGTATIFDLWEDSTNLGALARFEPGKITTTENGMVSGLIQRTPTSGAKVYTIRGWVNGASTGTMYLGNATTIPPATFRITAV